MMAEKGKNLGPEHAVTPVGQYYLLDKIAQGGMAEIYKGLAYDLHGIKKTVVIKKILPEVSADPEFVNMLINEAKIAVMLSHGNIAQIYDLGKVGNDYFMVMEHVDGKSLSQIHKRCLKNGHLMPIEYVCYFISEVANGLNYMHRRSDEQGRNLGIIHRDISPQNVIISYSGTVKIIDFGIAKAAIQINITESGILKGKFAYMAPEQARGDSVDHRSDIFSLGVILHELLTGRRLFKGKDKKETLQNVRRSIVPAPSSINSKVPPDMDKIVLKALSKDPRRRYLWASELHDDIIKFLHTHYPDFRPSSITAFIENLFREEIAEREEMEEEAKTPFLIIDHTQSAILPEMLDDTGITRIPPQLKSFLLDDETPRPEPMALVIPEERQLERPPSKQRRHINFKGLLEKHFKKVAVVATTLLFAAAIVYAIGIWKNLFYTPHFLNFLKPITIVTLNVEPEDATVVLGGETVPGTSPFKIKNIKPGTEFRLVVDKDGFLPYYAVVLLKEGEKRELDIALEPEPLHYAEVTITSDPSGATIFLNNENTNLKTPAKISYLRPKTYHTIGLYLENYGFWSRDIELNPDEKKSIDVQLETNLAGLEVNSNPSGADVALDGMHIGVTPIKLRSLKPDAVATIDVTKVGFKPWTTKIMVKAGQFITLRPNLERTKEYLKPGFLRRLEGEQRAEEERQMQEEQRATEEILPPTPAE